MTQKLLIIDDDIAVTTSISLLLRNAGFQVQTASGPVEALGLVKSKKYDLIIQDMNFSASTSGKEGLKLLSQIKPLVGQTPIILITAWGSINLAVEGMKLGASDFINKPWQNDQLLRCVKTAMKLAEKPALQTPANNDRKKLDEAFQFDNIIGQSPNLISILNTIARVAKTDASVLIRGESGTGKELFAEAIHINSLRSASPFIKVNLGGIPATLFESEMFGHKKGAFTDAKSDRNGRFKQAHTGTIFLDEIGDVAYNNQVKLLRVLQENTFTLLGSEKTENVDIRVISATNQDLESMVRDKTFREDLLYRINLITIQVPPLRERREDIPVLVAHFCANICKIYRKDNLSVSKEALQWLQSLTWPGNIRELKNLVERTFLVANKDILDKDDFLNQYQQNPMMNKEEAIPAVGTMTLEEVEVRMIRQALDFHKNNISLAANSLGLSRAALYRRLEKYDIKIS